MEGARAPIGERVKAFRQRAGLSQARLGRRVGVSQATVSKWEVAETHINADDLPVVAKALGVRVGAFYEDDVAEAYDMRDQRSLFAYLEDYFAQRSSWGTNLRGEEATRPRLSPPKSASPKGQGRRRSGREWLAGLLRATFRRAGSPA